MEEFSSRENRELQEVKRGAQAKIDTRNTLKHKFSGVDTVTIRHGMGRTPVGASVILQDKDASIKVLGATRTEITLKSSVANVNATILLI